MKNALRINHYYVFLILTFVFSCKSKVKLTKTEEQHYAIAQSEIDSNVYKTISPYKEKMSAKMEQVIGTSEAAFIKDLPEGSLGNFVCDILLNKFSRSEKEQKPIVLLNNGGLRASLPSGEIKVSHVYELMPFDNEIVSVKLSGKKMLELANYIAQKGGMPVAGCEIIIAKEKAETFKINGMALDTTKSYWVISSDYLTNGGDKMEFFKNPEEIIRSGKLIRDEIILFIEEQGKLGKTIKPYKDGRISISK